MRGGQHQGMRTVLYPTLDRPMYAHVNVDAEQVRVGHVVNSLQSGARVVGRGAALLVLEQEVHRAHVLVARRAWGHRKKDRQHM